jgi:hypothetical protein
MVSESSVSSDASQGSSCGKNRNMNGSEVDGKDKFTWGHLNEFIRYTLKIM